MSRSGVKDGGGKGPDFKPEIPNRDQGHDADDPATANEKARPGDSSRRPPVPLVFSTEGADGWGMSIRSILVSLLGVTVGALLPSCAHKHSYSDPALAAAISGSYRQLYPPHYSASAASLALGQGAGSDQALTDSEKLGSFTRRSGGPHVVATLRYEEMAGVRKLNDGIEPKLHRGMTPVAADMFEVGLSVGGKKCDPLFCLPEISLTFPDPCHSFFEQRQSFFKGKGFLFKPSDDGLDLGHFFAEFHMLAPP